jgi:hypothetical protein
MNDAELEQLQDYFLNVIDKSLDNLRSDLMQQLNDMLQNVSLDNAGGGFQVDGGMIDDVSDSLGNLGAYAVISSVLPLNVNARLPNGFNNANIFRPSLRRIGTIAGRSIAANLFDNNGGKVKYGSNQVSDAIKSGLDSLFS